MSYPGVVAIKSVEVTIEDLLQRDFCSRTREEQIRVLLKGKPRPSLNVGWYTSCPTSDVKSTFGVAVYDKIDWLTGCHVKQTLFCWPCLLFGKSKNAYNTSGVYGDVLIMKIPNLATEAHDKCVEHIQAILDMQMFIRQNILPNTMKDSDYNDLVLRNRKIMKRITDAICLVVTQKKAPRAKSYKNQLKVKDCLSALQFLQAYDDLEDNIVPDTIDLLQIFPDIVNDVVDTLTALVKSSIKEEIQESTFVSMILSQHSTPNRGNMQISTVLRYLKNGEVCERFVGFHNFDERTYSYLEIENHISRMAIEFNIEQRLLSLSFDGAMLRNGQLTNVFLEHLPTLYPYTSFVPCYFHNFHQVLVQGVSTITVCDYFFKTLTGIGTFLEKNRTKRKGFGQFIQGKVSQVEKFEFVKSSKSLNLLKLLRGDLIKYFDFVIQNCDKLNADDFAIAYGYRLFLAEHMTTILLEMFIKLFTITNDIDEILGSEMPERAFDSCMITQILKSLINEKQNGFDVLWNTIQKEMPANEFQISNKESHHAMFSNIVDNLFYQIKTRLEHLNQLEYFNLLNFSSESKHTAPHVLVTLLVETFGSSFDQLSLLAEIELLHTNDSFLIGKSMEQILQYFVSMNLTTRYKYFYKLTELILTMPCKPPSKVSGLSVLDKISALRCCPGKISGDVSLLSGEENLFLQIKSKQSFYDEIICQFQKINKTIKMEFRNY